MVQFPHRSNRNYNRNYLGLFLCVWRINGLMINIIAFVKLRLLLGWNCRVNCILSHCWCQRNSARRRGLKQAEDLMLRHLNSEVYYHTENAKYSWFISIPCLIFRPSNYLLFLTMKRKNLLWGNYFQLQPIFFIFKYTMFDI